MKVLHASHMERCIGCYSCVLACARANYKSFSWRRAGINIRSSGGISTGFEARFCLACEDPPCAIVCPTDALKPRKGGGVVLKRSLCIHCGECEKACPVNAIFFDPEFEIPVFCIHCGRCVKFCPHGCLELIDNKDL